MKKAPALQESDMWKKLTVLGQKQGSIRLSDLSFEMGLSEDDALAYIRQVFPQGGGVEVYFQNEECWVDVNADAIHYVLPLGPNEWLELHQLLEAQVHHSSPELVSLRRKVVENAPVQTLMKILSKLDEWSDELSSHEQEFMNKLDQSILDKKMLRLQTSDFKISTIFPCKIVHIEGELSIIAEDSQDHCLIIVPLKMVKAIDEVFSSSAPKILEFEVEEFIAAIRSMNEKEERLILKIHDPVAVNLFPHHHFLGKPCMITNSNGDLIWAAYVEPGPALYEWIISLGKHAEILDPLKFKAEYLSYCEEKLKNVA